MEILLIILVVVGALIFIATAWHLENKRATELQNLASSLGLSFRRAVDSTADERFARFAMFRRGRRRVAWNTIHGVTSLGGHEVEIEIGDFRYTVESGSGKNRRSRTHRFSYLVAHNPIGECPETIVRREGIFDRVAGVLGFDDIDFESNEFSRRYHVSSDDKRFAYDLIDPRVMEYVLETDPPAFELDGGLFCISDGRKRWEPEEFQGKIDWAGGFFERWPRHLADSMVDQRRSGHDS